MSSPGDPPNRSANGSPDGCDDGSQNIVMPQPMRPIHQILHTSEMTQDQNVAIARDPGHTSMLIQLANIAFRMNTFHSDFDDSTVSADDMSAFHDEFNVFASEMSRMTIESNARLMKSHSERDGLLEQLSEQRQQVNQLELKVKQLELQQRHQEQQRQQERQHLPKATMPLPPAATGAADSKKSKSEKISTRKALTIKVPRGPIPMAFPSTFRAGSSSNGMVPASPFMPGPSSGMVPLSPFVTTPSTPFVTTPSSPSDMMPRVPSMAAPLSNGPKTPQNPMMTSLRDIESPTRYVPVPASSIMGLSSTFGNLTGSSGLSPQKGPLAGASSSSAMATTTSFIRGPPPMDPNRIYMTPRPVNLSPLTPDRIGPHMTSATQPILNSVLRRRFNTLANIMPPSSAFIPEVPLTDTEIIVYLFQSLSRPEVALRLYARRWTPQTITEVLNKHRRIDGGYLRNTTSVRCTTSIKKGKRKHGRTWFEENTGIFANASDWLATQLIRQTGIDIEQSTDFDISELDRELIQHPVEGVDGGIFTKCVKWCCDRKGTSTYTLKNVHQLVLALKWGDDLDELSEIFDNENAQQQMPAQGVDGANNTAGLEESNVSNTLGQDNIAVNNTLSRDNIAANNTLGQNNAIANNNMFSQNNIFANNNMFSPEDFHVDDMNFDDFEADILANIDFEADDTDEYNGIGFDFGGPVEPAHTGKGKEPAYQGKGKGRAM